MELHILQNSSRPFKRRKRVGRGIGSGRGKTCCRGVKGDSARSGEKVRSRFEGGQVPLFRKMPVRGFTRGRHLKRYDSINLQQIDRLFSDGELVDMFTLRAKGFLKGFTYGIKVLGEGELTKKVTISVQNISDAAIEKLEKHGIQYEIV